MLGYQWLSLINITSILILLWLIWFSHRYAWWRRTVDWSAPRILMYHMVSNHMAGAKFNKMRVTPAAFAAQIRWLSEQGFTFVTMSQLQAQYQTLPAKTVALTFDDGFADNLLQALPILQQYQACATIYLVVDRHERNWDVYKKAHHNSGELAREPKLTDAQVQTLLDSGLIEIGSHTLTHVNLAKSTDAVCETELSQSRLQLQQLTAQPVTGFAYPFGIYTQRDVLVLQRLGYQHAVTVTQGIDMLRSWDAASLQWFHLKRIKVSGTENMYAFKTRLRTGHRGWR